MRVQKAKIRRVIEAEQKLIADVLVHGHRNPGHCAIGALLFAAGCSNRYLASLPNATIEWTKRHKATAILREEYGLTRLLAERISNENDRSVVNADERPESEVIVVRRRNVLKAVSDLPRTAGVDFEDHGL